MAIVAPPTSRAAARPIRADLVMIFIQADLPRRKNNPLALVVSKGLQ
jgi:hypothetical protein